MQVHESNAQKRDLTDSNVLSLKDRAYAFLNMHHDLKPKILCKLLDVPYEQKKGYVRQLRCEWKREYRIGLGPKCPTSQHNCRAYCYVPRSVDRKSALEVGWVQSRNRNRVFVLKDPQYGRIEWWESRKVLVHINKPQTLGRVKQFLSNAFFKTGLIWDDRVFNPWIESVQWFGAHDVYRTAEKVPYQVIETYRDSLGLVFRAGDLSHPDSYEFEWCKPSWMERFELLSRQALVNLEQNGRIVETDAKALQQTSQAIAQFNEFMKDLSMPRSESKDRKDPMIV